MYCDNRNFVFAALDCCGCFFVGSISSKTAKSKKAANNAAEDKYKYTGDLPLGLGMALTQNIPAMKVFAGLPEERRQDYINRAHNVSSRKEMAELVSTLLN